MRVTEIWRYPVKSLGGERLESADVGETGVVGDRMWGVFDPATELVLTARREPSLLFLSARIVDGRPVITDERGAVLDGDAALSAHIGRPVALRSATDGPGTFENPLNVDDESDWVRWESAGTTFHDGRSTISFVSAETLGDWDARRFRINLILDGYGEDEMTGEVSIGSTSLSIRKPIDRCVMVTRAQPGIERDLGVLKEIIRERDNKLGVGAVVASPGRIAVGDTVTAA